MFEMKPRKPEDTAAGCRHRAQLDREQALSEDSAQMRLRLETSAQAWTVRAQLLTRLETSRSGLGTP